MSVEAVSWAINKAPVGGNVTARMILVSLADKADEYGRDAWKYTSAIADSIRKSDATVFRTLAWLEEIGVIERGDQRLVDHYPEYARPVVWNLRLDLVQEPIERQKRKGRAGRPRKPATDALNESKRFEAPLSVYRIAEMTKPFLSLGNQYGEGWFLAGEMIELITHGTPNVVCIQPFACLPNHVVGKGVIKALKKAYPQSNIAAVDYDPGASEVNQLNRIKLMLSTAKKNIGLDG